MDPGRAPLRVFLAPEGCEASAMPPKDGLRLNHLGHHHHCEGVDDQLERS
jgi:hypothetical protein